jgi:hypothetical protein
MKVSRYIIYAVTLREHEGIVKLGRTTNWKTRRREYDCWNFADYDGVSACSVFMVTEEYVDLTALEKACLAAMANRHSLFRGAEWFSGDLQDAEEVIAGVLEAAQISYIKASGQDSRPKLRQVGRLRA